MLPRALVHPISTGECNATLLLELRVVIHSGVEATIWG